MGRAFKLTDFAYAHRGLWTPEGPPENTMAAYLMAASNGFGIEFDVRPAVDGTPMLFHDKWMIRLTGAETIFEDMTPEALSTLTILDSDEHIPSLEDLLTVWPKDLPLLTEMKIDGVTDPEAFAQRVGGMLMEFDGLAAAMSFNEGAVNALPDGLMTGQLIDTTEKIGAEAFGGVMHRARERGVDYFAVNVTDMGRANEALSNAKLPITTWTVRTEAHLAEARALGLAPIFEGLPLPLVKGTTTL